MGEEANPDRDLSGLMLSGTPYEIRPHTTIDYLLGATNSAGLAAGANQSDADNVQLVTTGGGVETIWYSNVEGNQGWKDAAGDPAGGLIVFPEEGVLVKRKQADPLNIYQQGALLAGPMVVPVEVDYSLVGTLKTETAVSLDGLGLFTGDPATGVASGLNPSEADNLIRVNADGTTSRFFYLESGGTTGWYSSTYQVAGAELIAPGQAFYLLRRASNGAAFDWTISSE